MDIDDVTVLRRYGTFEEALVAAKSIVERDLNSLHRDGMSADDWISMYQNFGDDVWIRPCLTDDARKPIFSSWEYAEAVIRTRSCSE